MNRTRSSAQASLFAILLLSTASAGTGITNRPVDDVPYSIATGTELELPWDARAVRHLFNRAGFGMPAAELEGHVQRSPEEVVDELLHGGRSIEPFFARRPGLGQYRVMAGMDDAAQREVRAQIRTEDRKQLQEYAVTWVEDMLEHVDPLRDRMTLFWHGFFTTSSKPLRRNFEVIRQHQFVRDQALGSYAELLSGMVRDPAMIYYLDNNSNTAGKPNENLARELMELFSLGEGNYTERDVQEVARALTGYTAGREGNFRFDHKSHDRGVKEILGQRGRFDGDDVVRILLAQEACAEWVSGRLIEYLEGAWPEADRHAEYAALLRDSGYELTPLLHKLFLDPAFYRDEVVGTRVQGPVDYVVGCARRLRLEPSGRYLIGAAGSCGQQLFQPPNVKGWEEGEAWITTSSLLQRGNVAGLLLGVLDLESAFARGGSRRRASSMDSMQPRMDGMRMDGQGRAAEKNESNVPKALAKLSKSIGENYQPRINLTWRMEQAGARTDEEIADAMLASLLAIEPPPDTKATLIRFLRSERARHEVAVGRFHEQPERFEEALRHLAHLILSLPEAQLS